MSSSAYKTGKTTGLAAALSVNSTDITITGFAISPLRLSTVSRQTSQQVSVTTSVTIDVADVTTATTLAGTIAGAADSIMTHTNNAMAAMDWSGDSLINAAPA